MNANGPGRARALTSLLPVAVVLVLPLFVGCGEAEHLATTSKTTISSSSVVRSVDQAPAAAALPAFQQAEDVEAAFRTAFLTQFDEGANKGYLQHAAVTCHNEGVGSGGDQNFLCEGWGVAGSGNCLLVTAEPATVKHIPTLVSNELAQGEAPFDPGSCRIAGEPN